MAADDTLRAQYEAYPYPVRDPADERDRLITGSPSHLDELNHYLFAGARNFAAPFRALIAGGGTGDGAVMLAQQLAQLGGPAELVYLDLSGAAMAVAEARAAARGLTNIAFHRASLLDVAELGLGRFDYIDCCGVLHHLADPAAGLAALASVLAADGGIGLMVYGALGRTGVYPAQAAIRALAGDAPDAERLAIARRLLDDLPRDNWLRKNPYIGDHTLGDDAALYDLLLHARDRAYTVSELAALVDDAGLAITGFIEPLRYDPLTYLDDAELRRAAAALPWLARCALAENLSGALKSHVCYVTRAARANVAPARADGPEVVPVLREQDPATLARALAKTGRLEVNLDGHRISRALPDGAPEIVGLCDGRLNLAEIQDRLGLDQASFRARCDALYAALNGVNLMLLRRPPDRRAGGD